VLLIWSFAASLLTTLVLTPLVRRIARARGFVAPPSADRWHKAPTALFGGIAIYGGVLAGGLVAYFASRDGISLARGPSAQTIGIAIGASLLFLGGVVDDRYKLRPTSKLVLQAVAGALVVAFGVVFPITPWPTLNALFTVFWMIMVTNALNLLDNMDGLATGVAAVAALFLSISFALDGGWTLAALCAALFGATLGFLRYNFHPASIFMGDSGSLFIGGLLASLGAAYPLSAPSSLISVLFVPALIVIIPLADTMFVTLMRTMAGRPISVGGRDHTSHRLVAMGLSEPQVALLLYTFAACGGVLALVMRTRVGGFGFVIGSLFLVVLAIVAAYLGRMHKYAPADGPNTRSATVLVTNILYKRNAFEVVFDLLLFSAAYAGAYYLRYDDLQLAPQQARLLEQSFAIVVACKSVSFGLLGVYRGVWNQLSFPDVHRILKATLLGSLLATFAVAFFFRDTTFSRSVLIIDAVLTVMLTVGSRASFRSLDRVREGLTQHGGDATIIYGAGRGGELLARELRTNRRLRLKPVAFIDDDPYKHGRLIAGLPVASGLARLPAAIETHQAKRVILSTHAVSELQLRELREVCRMHGIDLLEMRLELRHLHTELQARSAMA
jgi:UDP-GlcNAc:undecaprenyl-phosphate/decaprenyl-phosphate GlcNAc-1-phosphate transferase